VLYMQQPCTGLVYVPRKGAWVLVPANRYARPSCPWLLKDVKFTPTLDPTGPTRVTLHSDMAPKVQLLRVRVLKVDVDATDGPGQLPGRGRGGGGEGGSGGCAKGMQRPQSRAAHHGDPCAPTAQAPSKVHHQRNST
jgi:hypothetical protein